MNTIKISTKLNKALVDYLCTTFDVSKDKSESELAYQMRQSFEQPEALFNGPFLELILPYKTGSSLDQLAEDGVISNKFLQLSCLSSKNPKPIPATASLYTHQEKAIRKLCSDHRSIVVSAGTGSGKTESFIIPIINDLLEDNTPGVRAILVYPLNALVNDQLDRLRTLLKDTEITFGRYTGELKNEQPRTPDTLPNEIISRNEIREEGRIPQILITNYAMLEYLLLRPEDSILFQSGQWKYLVLDEAHTYSGAQGIEVAMLVRRLKQRLGKRPGDMQCIATSATLVNDDASDAVSFAENLFGESFKVDDIIFGESSLTEADSQRIKPGPIASEKYLHPNFDDLIEELRSHHPRIEDIALWMNQIGLTKDATLDRIDLFENSHAFLYDSLINNQDLLRLRKWMIDQGTPLKAIDCAQQLFPELDFQDSITVLYRMIELGSLARPEPDVLPLIPAKYHLFARPPQGIWVCINPACPEQNSKNETDKKWSKIFSTPHERCDSCGSMVYPIYLCRQCGQVFIATHKNNNCYLPASETIIEETTKQYFTWKPVQENLALADGFDEESEESQDQNQEPYKQEKILICLDCGKEDYLCKCTEKVLSTPLFDIQEMEKKSRGKNKTVVRWKPTENLNQCPRCGSSSKGETEIATPISLLGTAPLANLTYELYRLLPASKDKNFKKLPGEGRKLLTFYDSRQGAARFAAFLQDVANKQNYRHLIPKAIDQYWREKEHAPSFNGLIQTCTKMALENRIIQNDPDAKDFWRKGGRFFSREEREEANTWVAAQVLGEITTGMKQRQSIESLGLVSIQYFEDLDFYDFDDLSERLGLTIDQTNTLIKYLLDDLRYQKAIKLPESITSDDPVFGPNKGNPRLIRQGTPSYGQIRWIGVTQRQRRRQYIKLVLESNNLPSTDEDVENALTQIWDFLIEETDIFEGSAADGQQLRLERLFFQSKFDLYQCQRCLRLSSAGASLPCPAPNCGGNLEKIDNPIVARENYYYNLFQEDMIPIRVEEHTAQLDPDKGREYQDLFKAGNINVLSCSTTFEMGIDLGDLQSVAMSNVPPSIANYRQRSGRAGRRTSGTAFILTWASGRPHDQAYYSNPAEIIGGQVAIPNIFLENPFITRRHANAILLSKFLRFRKSKGDENLKTAGDFFDRYNQTNPLVGHLEEWLSSNSDDISLHLKEYQDMLPVSEEGFVEQCISNFVADLTKVDLDEYQKPTNYYINQIENLADKYKEAVTTNIDFKKISQQIDYYQRLLKRIRGEYLINYLSSKGVLPSYSFPLYTVELTLPMQARAVEHLRLERDLSQAIREYAPGSEIVADKRVWRSKKPLFWKDTIQKYDYKICEYCHNLEMSDISGMSLPANQECPICGKSFSGNLRRFVIPDGFMADDKSGKPAKQYVNIEPSQMRSAILPLKTLVETQISDLVFLAYERKGKLLYVNEGRYGRGFKFPLERFGLLDTDASSSGNFSLGHIQTTDTLHIRFAGTQTVFVPSPEDEGFWLSLMYAILHAASHSLQIERNDINGVLSPRKRDKSWEQTIVLYDNVPGGAGHVKKIQDHFKEVLEDAIRVLNCPDCSPETSCHHCLRDYNNQFYHRELVRQPALKFLEIVLADLNPLEESVDGASRVITSNSNTWFLRQIENATQSVELAVEGITIGHPLGDNYSWFDTFTSLINKGCKLKLSLQNLPPETPVGLSISKQLQVLLERGMELHHLEKLPEWQVVIDTNNPSNSRAVKSANSHPISLGATIGANHLITTSTEKGVLDIYKDLSTLKMSAIKPEELSAPENVKVINLYSSSRSYTTVEELFKEVFSKPCSQILVNDPYLLDRERIFLLEPYLELAFAHKELEKVTVHTKKATDFKDQKAAEDVINKQFNNRIEFKHIPLEHDRYFLITRPDGEQARIILGRGLDFIQSDGSIKSTFIVIQDPIKQDT